MSDNTAYAVLGSGCFKCTTNKLWQYDYGQKLNISGIELPSTFEVHFCNRGDAETITQIGNQNEVSIPDQFLTKAPWIDAFLYLHNGADDGETVYKISIPVCERPEPGDQEPTPQEQSAITEAIAALNAAVERVEQAALYVTIENNIMTFRGGQQT